MLIVAQCQQQNALVATTKIVILVVWIHLNHVNGVKDFLNVFQTQISEAAQMFTQTEHFHLVNCFAKLPLVIVTLATELPDVNGVKIQIRSTKIHVSMFTHPPAPCLHTAAPFAQKWDIAQIALLNLDAFGVLTFKLADKEELHA